MKFNTLKEFYPYYLQEHRDARCRLCHLAGSSTVVGILAFLAFTGAWSYIWVCLLAGYGPAWVGHFFFENNQERKVLEAENLFNPGLIQPKNSSLSPSGIAVI